MSWFTRTQQGRRRLAMKAQGHDPYAIRRDPNAKVGEFNALSSSIAGERAGFNEGMTIDTAARAMGVNGTVMKADPNLPHTRLIDTAHMRPSADPAPVRKAQHVAEVPRFATAFDGGIALERIAKADGTGFLADRVDLDNPNVPAPQPPQSEATDFTTLIALINNAVAAAVRSVLPAANSPLATTVQRTTRATAQISKSDRPRAYADGTVDFDGGQAMGWLFR